jgi:hypothetical protein
MERILLKFKLILTQFLDVLIGWRNPVRTELLDIRMLVDSDIPTVLIMNTFIKTVYPFKDNIKQKDLNFFITNKDIASDDSYTLIRTLCDMMSIPDVLEEEKESVWEWLNVIILICEKYKEEKDKEE